MIGREPSKCDLICSSEKVSRVHLSIAYRAVGGKGEYFVKDMSTNGTISSKTGKLPKEQEVKQPVGAVLTLVSQQNPFSFCERKREYICKNVV